MARIVKQKHWWALKILEKWETANPNWRPKKWISLINSQLKELWYTPATKQDIEETYLQMIQLTENELKQLFADVNQPILVKVIASNLTKKNNFDVIEKILDRGVWKSTQQVNIDAKVEDSSNPLWDKLKKLWYYWQKKKSNTYKKKK